MSLDNLDGDLTNKANIVTNIYKGSWGVVGVLALFYPFIPFLKPISNYSIRIPLTFAFLFIPNEIKKLAEDQLHKYEKKLFEANKKNFKNYLRLGNPSQGPANDQ